MGEVSADGYAEMVSELLRFLEGDSDPVLDRLESEMAAAAGELDYERAARLRDRLAAVRKAVETQQMVGSRNEDFDVIGLVDDALEAAVQVFFVRRGRVMGRRGFMIDKAEDLDRAELVSRALERLYCDDNPLGWPKLVLAPDMPAEVGLYTEWLSEMRGSRVEIRVPQRGSKRALQATVIRNAEESFTRHRLKRSTDHNSRARALNELQNHLGLAEAPLRIECFDMSHLSGQDYVGSMVVLEDGLPKKADYRRFKIRTVAGNDDFAAMHEVLTRRLTGYLEQRARPVAERDGRFSYPPQLLLWTEARDSLAWPCRCWMNSASRRTSPPRRWPNSSRRCSCPAGPAPCGSRASRRPCTCCSASATRATASRSHTTAACATSA